MSTKILVTAAALLFSVSSAAAAPKLIGTYTVTSVEMCQAVGTAATPTDKGSITQMLATVVATATDLKLAGSTQTAPMFDSGASPFKRTTFTETQTYTVSGTTNPYSLTMTKSNGKSQVLKANFNEVNAAGVAGSMSFLVSYSNKGGATNCVGEVSFVKH